MTRSSYPIAIGQSYTDSGQLRCLAAAMLLAAATSSSACAPPEEEPRWDVSALPSQTGDGLGITTCAELETTNPLLFSEVCDSDGDGESDEDDTVVIIDPGADGVLGTDDDEPILIIKPGENDGDPPQIIFPDGTSLVGDTGRQLHPNPGCELAVVFEILLDMPPDSTGRGCAPPPMPDPQLTPICRDCLAAELTTLGLGIGTVGECSLAKAIANTLSNRFQHSLFDPTPLQLLAIAALNVLDLAGRGGANVPCPPDLAALDPNSTPPAWDDELYAGRCTELCDTSGAGPRSCFGGDLCASVFYLRDDASGDYALVDGAALTAGEGVVDTRCTEVSFGADDQLELCCPNPVHDDADLVFRGVGCGYSGALAPGAP